MSLNFGVEDIEIGSDGRIASGLCSLCEKDLIAEDETYWIKTILNQTYYHSTCFFHVAWAIKKFLSEFGIVVDDAERAAPSGNYN